jgi:hypothetical protein
MTLNKAICRRPYLRILFVSHSHHDGLCCGILIVLCSDIVSNTTVTLYNIFPDSLMASKGMSFGLVIFLQMTKLLVVGFTYITSSLDAFPTHPSRYTVVIFSYRNNIV